MVEEAGRRNGGRKRELSRRWWWGVLARVRSRGAMRELLLGEAGMLRASFTHALLYTDTQTHRHTYSTRSGNLPLLTRLLKTRLHTCITSPHTPAQNTPPHSHLWCYKGADRIFVHHPRRAAHASSYTYIHVHVEINVHI